MADVLLPFPPTERSTPSPCGHATDFFGKPPMAGALDGKSAAGRRHSGWPSSRANRPHALYLT